MPNDTLSLLQRLQEYGLIGYFWLLVVSVWAGSVKYLTELNGKKPKFTEWLVESFVSGFVGVITGLVCQSYGLSLNLTLAISGIAAHNGTRSLYIITEIIKKNSAKISNVELAESKQAKLSRKDDK